MVRFARRILVVDDEADTRALLEDILLDEGYEVHLRANGNQALQAVKERHYDLVLADLKMPGLSGLELLRRVRQISPSTQVIIMTAFASVETVRQAWKDEAFYYLVKPFALDEVRDQVAEALRDRQLPPVVHYRGLRLDRETRRVWIEGREVDLTRLEFDVLAYLFRYQGCPVSPQELLREVWDREDVERSSTDTVKSCISRIRRKLGDDARDPRYVFNEWGVGYQLGE